VGEAVRVLGRDLGLPHAAEAVQRPGRLPDNGGTAAHQLFPERRELRLTSDEVLVPEGDLRSPDMRALLASATRRPGEAAGITRAWRRVGHLPCSSRCQRVRNRCLLGGAGDAKRSPDNDVASYSPAKADSPISFRWFTMDAIT